MVLARQRSRLSPLADELRVLGVPTVQPEKADLSEAPEVQDIVALLDVLLSPAHDLSLARALKSPLFGASDADLTALALLRREERHKGRPWLDLLHSEASGLSPTLHTAAAALAQYQAWVQSLPPHDALDAIYHHGDVLGRFAAAAPPEQRAGVLANLRALLGAALAQGGGRYLTPYALVRALRQGGIPAPGRADAQAVRLLTIHGAKGLEAPVVFLPGLRLRVEGAGEVAHVHGHVQPGLGQEDGEFLAPHAAEQIALELERIRRARHGHARRVPDEARGPFRERGRVHVDRPERRQQEVADRAEQPVQRLRGDVEDVVDLVAAGRADLEARLALDGIQKVDRQANSDLTVRLWIEAREIAAAGYRLYVFYP